LIICELVQFSSKVCGKANMRRLSYYALLLMPIISTAGYCKDVEIISHRGASYVAPENTVASVVLAWEKNADAAEIDVYLSKDNRIVVIHDHSTKRTAGVDLEVKDTNAAELRKLDVGSFKNAKYANERIPFLEEIIATVPSQKRLFVEIKCGPEILPLLKSTIAASGKKKQIVIIGFDLKTMAASKKLMPDIPTHWLVMTNKDEKTNIWLPHNPKLIQTAKDNGLDGVDVHYAGVTREFSTAAESAGQRLYVWTVDDIEEAKRLKNLGVSGITTNQPDLIREKLFASHQ
jgi:glycerophosphoryl diester phosphodiesterase